MYRPRGVQLLHYEALSRQPCLHLAEEKPGPHACVTSRYLLSVCDFTPRVRFKADKCGLAVVGTGGFDWCRLLVIVYYYTLDSAAWLDV